MFVFFKTLMLKITILLVTWWQLKRPVKVQRAMERILYIWAIRHPASGYVQGINDLLTPLYIVFLSAHVGERTT